MGVDEEDPLFLCVFAQKVLPDGSHVRYGMRQGAHFLSFLWRERAISELFINEQIRDREIRLIGENGEQLGIMSSREAMKLAEEAGLDLVKIAPTAKPPVCKIVDYGKYRYELARKEKEAKKKQKTIEIKEVRLSPNIDVNADAPNKAVLFKKSLRVFIINKIKINHYILNLSNTLF